MIHGSLGLQVGLSCSKGGSGQDKVVKMGTVKPVKISDEMRNSYLKRAMSVIGSRALGHARHGLKPVLGRMLCATHGPGLRLSKRLNSHIAHRAFGPVTVAK